jgi:sodium-coupled neutral amino acid transporter 11
MPLEEGEHDYLTGQTGHDDHESNLLPSPTEQDENDLSVHADPAASPPDPANGPRSKRQSSITQPALGGQRRTPRTTNRVRFLEEPPEEHDDQLSNGRTHSPDDAQWLDEEDYELGEHLETGNRNGGQSVPLLTNIEAPSVTLATSDDFFPEDHLEDARPRSGMRMAFMNMANSIIGAGIIGQPYALRQAGLTTGILLLTALTVTVDWTIRLIVINSKLSGADSFQATMQYCFGRSGLIAISVAQWAFAFGGMVAFCIIVGDTIPHVFAALFPSLRNMSFLWLLTDRRAVIVIFVLCISYPLSLYRDIAKVSRSSLRFATVADGPTAGESICSRASQHDRYRCHSNHSRFPCAKRIERRIQKHSHCEFGLLSGRWCDFLW